MEPGKPVNKIADVEEPFNIIEYQSAISGLIYVSVATRPDLPYA